MWEEGPIYLGLGYVMCAVGSGSCHCSMGACGDAHGYRYQRLCAELLEAVMVPLPDFQLCAWYEVGGVPRCQSCNIVL